MAGDLIRAATAEFLGTSLLVWCGCGSAVASGDWLDIDNTGGRLVGIAMGFGFTVTSMAYSIGHISGCHINPGVTFSFLVLRELSIFASILYIVAQCAGAWFGALVLWGCVGSKSGLGVNVVADGVTTGNALMLEGVGTFLLCFVVLHSALHKASGAGNAAPIGIGWAVLLAHLVLIPYTGCGINPARVLGPLIVNSMDGLNFWDSKTWTYFVAPFIGSGIAALVYRFIFMNHGVDDEDDEPVRGPKDLEEAESEESPHDD